MPKVSHINRRAVKFGWGLVRVSTKGQAEVQHGSLEQQRHMLDRWAERESERSGYQYKITRVIEEDISGREQSTHKRTGYQECLKAIKAGEIEFFVIEKIDRLGRSKIENQRFIELAQEHDVEVHEVESGQINLRDRGSRLGFNIKNMWAEEYSLELEEKVTKKQREARVNNGKDTSTCPVLSLDPHPSKAGMYVINRDEQKVVIDLFEHFLRTGSFKELVEHCERKGYRTKVRQTKQKIDKDGNIVGPRAVGGESLTPKSLYHLLTNPKYRGFSFFKDSWNQFPKLQDENGMVRWNYAHGAVVELELFEKVQDLLRRNAEAYTKARGEEAVYLLSGSLRMWDNSPFQGASAKSGQARYYQNLKHKVRVPKDRIETIVTNRVRQYLEESGTLEKLIAVTHKHRLVGLPFVEEEIHRVRQKATELEKVVQGFSDAIRKLVLQNPDNISMIYEAMTAEKAKAELELVGLKAELEELLRRKERIAAQFQEKTLQDYLRHALKRFEEKSNLQKKRIIQSIIPMIVVHEDNRVELKINLDPGGSRTVFVPPCHGSEETVRVTDKWRE